jgi:dihydroxyacetone kinase
MTSTTTSATTFAHLSLDGFVKAHRVRIAAVDGGVILRSRRADAVAVVAGGGSGHYPAFAGMVGTGMASAAVCGDIFASPSSGQVFRVAEAADSGAGVLLVYGNYMGDVLHFSHAQEKLRAHGRDVRTQRVTDDVASAPSSERSTRRGVAGDLFVIKIAGASAERGDTLDQVERFASRANAVINTFGVAFSGCTLPGAEKELFHVPVGAMALGLGVHGEPGIGQVAVPSPEELANILLTRLLGEPAPLPGKKITVLLNGLGAMKYEELFAVYGFLADQLTSQGFEIVEPEVGELVTSLDMNGCSLSIAWLDDELEELWRAACDSPGFKKVVTESRSPDAGPGEFSVTMAKSFVEPEGSEQCVGLLGEVFDELATLMADSEELLGELDSRTGDGDHGIGMTRGSRGAATAVAHAQPAGTIELLSIAAEGWSESGGGTSGAIWGILLGSLGSSLSASASLSAADVATAFAYAAKNVQHIGGAKPGDKTLVDALVPFSKVLRERVSAGDSLAQAWRVAALEADEQAQATADLLPRIGRAKIHGDKSLGTPDAGAVSLALALSLAGETITRRSAP